MSCFLGTLLSTQGLFPGFYDQSSPHLLPCLSKPLGFRDDSRDYLGQVLFVLSVFSIAFGRSLWIRTVTSLVELGVIRVFEFVERHWCVL